MSSSAPAARLPAVVHICSPAEIGGLETVVRVLSREQRKRGHEVHVVAVLSSPDLGHHPFIAGLRDDGIPHHVLLAGGRSYRQERRQASYLISGWGVDVVHTHGYRSDVIHGALGAHRDRITVSTVHGFTGGGMRNLLYEGIQRVALRRVDAVVAVARSLAVQLAKSGVPSDRLTVIPNAWDGRPVVTREEARRRLGLPADRAVIGWVGRLSHEKAPELLLDAFSRLEDREVLVAYVGDGEERPALEARAKSLGVADRVLWLGQVTGAGEVFSAFDLLVVSSRREGTPVVVLEAMAAGVPIVATNVGGVAEMLVGEAGVLVASEAPAAMARAIGKVLADASIRERLRAAGLRRVQEAYSPEAWVERYAETYAAAMERKRAREGRT